jgi:hypothetical protein
MAAPSVSIAASTKYIRSRLRFLPMSGTKPSKPNGAIMAIRNGLLCSILPMVVEATLTVSVSV